MRRLAMRGSPAVVALFLVACSAGSKSGASAGAGDGDGGALALDDGGLGAEAEAEAEAGVVSASEDGGATGDGGSSGMTPISCNAIAQQGPSVNVVTSTAVVPAPEGGPIANGTYVLSAFRQHTAQLPDGTKLFTFGRATLVVNVGGSQAVITDKNGVVSRATDTLTTAGIELTTTQSCQSPLRDGGLETKMAEYTATAISLTLFNATAQGTFESVYTKL